MSMGIIKSGEYNKVAGMSLSGELIMGASTIRKGTISVPAIAANSSANVTVTFADPMPNANYEVILNSERIQEAAVINKTANGFTVNFLTNDAVPASTGAWICSYTAFELFTVEGLEDLENDVAALKAKDTTKAITATITNSKAHSDSFLWVNRNGNVVQVAAKFAWNPGVQVSFLETWASGLPKPIHMLWPVAVAFAAQAGNPTLPLQFTVNGELKLDNGWHEFLAEHPSDRATDAYATFTYITDDPF